jgi:hypothetical protein
MLCNFVKNIALVSCCAGQMQWYHYCKQERIHQLTLTIKNYGRF